MKQIVMFISTKDKSVIAIHSEIMSIALSARIVTAIPHGDYTILVIEPYENPNQKPS
jgi:hypothetical protein